MSRRAVLSIGALLVFWNGCGAASLSEKRGGAVNFESGREAFDRKDYVEASQDFKAYVEQYPGTDKTDDALYYLGVSYMKTKEYALGSSQFDRLTRDFPQSEYQPDAMFYLARCDDLESRPAPLDQTETRRAIDRYKAFLDLYPESSHAKEAWGRMNALSDRLAEKRFRNGRLYLKLKQRSAAAIYFQGVMADYPESRWAGDSAVLLAEILVREGKNQEAIEVLRKVPNAATGDAKGHAKDLLKDLGASATP
jgi:outer membrane protein assembly factor BamD